MDHKVAIVYNVWQFWPLIRTINREFVRFVAVVNVGAYVGVFFATVLEYAVTMDSSWLFTSQAHGMGALMSGFIIAFKQHEQTVPEHSIRILNTISLRSKHLPSLYICLNFLLFALRIIHVQFFVVAFGTIVSWVYMRFFKRQEGIRGDRSETFSFASFFPDMLHPFIKPISNSVYKIFISLRCLPPVTNTLPLHATAGQGGLSQPPPNTTGPGYADTERRKAIALRALDMKLAGVTESVKKPEAQPPALNEPAQIGSTTSNGE
ncbi:hypothetical protein DFS34DRAFT_595424 [Phlyctochytrium arcticum]|nr:hypothetical protein DFS34DRAFT_595424 [Phlyctochytrium arcticum]